MHVLGDGSGKLQLRLKHLGENPWKAIYLVCIAVSSAEPHNSVIYGALFALIKLTAYEMKDKCTSDVES